MKKYLLLLILPFIIHSCGSASRINRADQPWSYETESVGVGSDGVYAIRIWSYYRTPDMPLELAKKNAVHSVIFKGVPAGNGASAQPPMKTGQSNSSDSLFFDSFFKNGYQNYIHSVAYGSRQVIKTGRREYKIGYVLSVAKDNLRKHLEDSGIIRPLSDGF